MEEDLFQAPCGRTQFIEIPAGCDHGARQVAAHQLSLLALHFKDQALLFALGTRYAADAGDRFELLLHQHGFRLAIAGGDFDQNRFGAARPRLQVAHRVGRHQLALVDDDHLLAGLFDFGKDVGAEDDGVVAGQALDQVAGFIDLLGIEARCRLVENQHVGVVNDRLRQPDALAIAFGEFAQKLVPDIRHKAAFADVVDALLQLSAGQALELAHEAQIFGSLHLGIERRRLGQISDALLDLEGLFENIEAGDRSRARRWGKKAGEHAHGRRLSRAVGAEKSNDLALGYGE